MPQTDELANELERIAQQHGLMYGDLAVIERAAAALRSDRDPAEVVWQPIETAPSACHVLAARFDNDCGEWFLAFVMSPPSKPFTHWRFVDPPSDPRLQEKRS